MDPMTWVQGAVFVVANSLHSSEKAVSAATHYNKLGMWGGLTVSCLRANKK